VLILKNAPYPYSELYKAYRFDEPWNGPNNARLAVRIGDYYRRQGLDAEGTEETSFVAVLGSETAWPGIETRSRSDLHDGADRTILLVEMAASGIPWMKPEDLHLDRMTFGVNDGSGRGPGSRISGARALMGTGHVLELPDDFSPAKLRAMLTIAGNEPVSADPGQLGARVVDAPPAPIR
jgi:hypothetical protein